jgi:cytoskeleton protein RodZ
MPEIGATLREARMHAKIDVADVEAATKIRAKYLRAIENEEWGLLPGPTFVKSFLRTYAQYLGLDATLLVDEYKLRHETIPEQELRPIGPPAGAQRQRSRLPQVSRGVLAAACVAAVVVLLIVIGSVGDSGSSNPSPSASTKTAAPATPAPATTPRPAPKQVAVTLLPQSDVYACLRDADGRLVVNATLSPSGPHRVHRSRSFRLTVASSAIRLRVDAKIVAIPVSTGPVNLEITPGGHRTLPRGQGAC